MQLISSCGVAPLFSKLLQGLCPLAPTSYGPASPSPLLTWCNTDFKSPIVVIFGYFMLLADTFMCNDSSVLLAELSINFHCFVCDLWTNFNIKLSWIENLINQNLMNFFKGCTKHNYILRVTEPCSLEQFHSNQIAVDLNMKRENHQQDATLPWR